MRTRKQAITNPAKAVTVRQKEPHEYLVSEIIHYSIPERLGKSDV
jgi:hypothetical protein